MSKPCCGIGLILSPPYLLMSLSIIKAIFISCHITEIQISIIRITQTSVYNLQSNRAIEDDINADFIKMAENRASSMSKQVELQSLKSDTYLVHAKIKQKMQNTWWLADNFQIAAQLIDSVSYFALSWPYDTLIKTNLVCLLLKEVIL